MKGEFPPHPHTINSKVLAVILGLCIPGLFTSPGSAQTPAISEELEPVESLFPDAMEQVTSVNQLRDVKPTDWAFQALRNLVESYGCLVGYPDSTYRGDRSMTRYEFAAALNSCLDYINRTLTLTGDGEIPSQRDFEVFKRLREEFVLELSLLRGQVDGIEARTRELELTQFSTTTKLNGQVTIGVQGRTSNEADLFPRDGDRETDDPGDNINLISLTHLSLSTSFNPRSSLYIGLLDQRGSGDPKLTSDGRVAYDFGETDGFILSDLNYRFLIGGNFAGYIGTEGVNMTTVFEGANRFKSAGSGPISFFAQRNPLLNIGLGEGGVGFDWQFSERASLKAVYSTTIPGFFVNENAAEGHNTGAVQLALTPIEPLDITIYYVNDYSPDGFLISFAGDEQLTATNPSTGDSAPLQTNAVGTTINWQVSPSLVLGGWTGYTNSYIPGESGRVETVNYMLFANFPDLFGEGNLGGIYVGQPPKIISSNLSTGNNIPDFFDTGEGDSGRQPGTTIHLEAFYRWQLSDNISVTPGLIYVFQPGHSPDSDSFAVGAVRTNFSF